MKKLSYLIIVLLAILALSLAACGGGSTSANPAQSGGNAPADKAAQTPGGDPVAGKQLFAGTCATCHGPAGEGLPGLGKDMTTSQFIAGKTDQELVDFVKVGRDPSDPLNTTGVAMPPKGGNPALTDQNLFDIVAYIRTIHK